MKQIYSSNIISKAYVITDIENNKNTGLIRDLLYGFELVQYSSVRYIHDFETGEEWTKIGEADSYEEFSEKYPEWLI